MPHLGLQPPGDVGHEHVVVDNAAIPPIPSIGVEAADVWRAAIVIQPRLKEAAQCSSEKCAGHIIMHACSTLSRIVFTGWMLYALMNQAVSSGSSWVALLESPFQRVCP